MNKPKKKHKFPPGKNKNISSAFAKKGKPSFNKHKATEYKKDSEAFSEAGEQQEKLPKDFIYGKHPVLEALKEGLALNKIWIQENIKSLNNIIELVKNSNIPYKFVTRNDLQKLLKEDVNHQGIVASLASHDYAEFTDVLNLCGTKNMLLLILDQINDPHNLGAIIRTAAASGVDAIIVPKHRAVGITGTVAKTAAGALARLPVCRVTNLAQAVNQLKQKNVWIAGIDMDGQEKYFESNLKGSLAFIMGSEGKGLSPLLKENCDFTINIPMQEGANSLNVSVATGIILFEAFRQRNFS